MPSISLRLVDANLNRASEGLRVLEDLARFVINDAALTRELKAARHELARLVQPLDTQLLSWRDSATDVGRESTLHAGVRERDLLVVVRANAKRAEESLRVIEELARLPELGARINSGEIERLRYATYDIEKRLAGRVLRGELAAGLRGLYVIVDREASGGRALNDVAREAIAGGASVIQLRDKVGGRGEVYRSALQLNALCCESGVLFVMNDYADVAVAVGAAALHVGQEDLPLEVARRLLPIDTMVGVSCHSMEDVRRAQEEGADYIAVGSVFPTLQKENPVVVGVEFVRRARQQVPGMPLVAIGGIALANAAQVVAAGADAIAVIGAVVGQPDVSRAARELVSEIRRTEEQGEQDEHESA
jgi:thiamine-phosphate pyrophosphorylase